MTSTSLTPDPAVRRISGWRFADDGIRADGDGDGVLDLLVDGRRIWSFHFRRDSEPEPIAGARISRGASSTRFVPWPNQLRKFLHGTATFTVTEHLSGVVLHKSQVSLGDGDGHISVVDDRGRILAVDKSGRMQELFVQGSSDSTTQLLDIAEEVIGVLLKLDVHVFPSYGTLLGAVRGKKLIAFDSDVDLSYLSRFEHPADAIRESYLIERALVYHGFEVHRGSGLSMKIRIDEASGTRRGMDLFGGFICEGTTLYVLGELAYPMRREQVMPLGTVELEGRTFPAPAEPESWLEMTYGPSWRIPDPAYHFDRARGTSRRFEGWFWGIRYNRNPWHHRYGPTKDNKLRRRESSFARWVHQRVPRGVDVVEVGAGKARDTLYYARHGHDVVALDFVPSGWKQARRISERKKLPISFEVVNFNDIRAVLACGASITRRTDMPVVVARFVADGLSPEGRDYFWRFLRMVGRGNDPEERPCLLEVVDHAVGEWDYFAERNVLRPIPLRRLRAEIESHGGRVVEHAIIPPRGKVPQTIRLVLAWT